MMTKKHKLLMWIFAALSAILTLAVYPSLPDQIPINWGFNGQIDYGSKINALFLGAIPLILVPLFIYLPKADPRKKNYDRFSKYYGDFGVFLMIFLLIFTAIILSESLWPGRISVTKVLPLMMGGLMIFIGNMMPKFKSNFFVGIKTPWTISDPDVWNKTHRLGGALFFWSGILYCLGCLWLPELVSFVVLMVFVLVSSIVPTVMSYLWYREKEKAEEE